MTLAGRGVVHGRIVGRENHDELLDAQYPDRTLPIGWRRPDREIGLPGDHRGEEFVGVPVLEKPDVDTIVRATPGAQHRWQHPETDGIHRGQVQFGAVQPGCLPSGTASSLRVSDRGAGMRQHRPAHRRESQ